MEIERQEHGWFKPGEHSYAPLLRSKAVDLLAKSYPESSRPGNLYQLKWFLEFNQVGPQEFLDLPKPEIKMAIRRAMFEKSGEGHYAAARRMFYVVIRFLELNEKSVSFTKTEKKAMMKKKPKRIGRQHVPTIDEIYRMVDAVPNKGTRQQARARAILLCLWQSGVRASCLCSWVYGMFRDKLWPEIKVPIPIKVVAYRPPDVVDCAEDTKLSSYHVDYYFTFLHREAAQSLKSYLEERKASGWIPTDEDPVFVTEGTASVGKPIDFKHVIEIVKNAAGQIGVDPGSIWTHCLRKAFRKALYRGGVEPDVAEALMGHKLPGSRGSYFDYHDMNFVAAEYMRGFWKRMTVDRVRELEEEIAKLRRARESNSQKKEKEIEQVKKDLKTRELEIKELTGEIRELHKTVSFMEDRLFEAHEQSHNRVSVEAFLKLLTGLSKDKLGSFTVNELREVVASWLTEHQDESFMDYLKRHKA